MIKYWGEIPVSSSQPSRSSFDLLQREFRTVEIQDPPMHQPSAERPRAATVLDVPSEPCGLTLHTIQLIQYNRRLRGLVAAAQGQAQAQAQGQPQADGLKAEEPEPLPPPPSSPLLPEELLPLDSKTPTFPFQLRHSDPESDFYRGKGEPATELSWTSCRQLLYQSVATVLAHAGFECAHESVLETLTDVASEYYYKFTRLLRSAADREARVGRTPFQDVMEQVFHEMGIGSVLSLQSFWQHRIKDYHTYMLQVSKQLAEEYEKLVSPEKTSAEDTKPLKIKEEPLSDIAFPVNEENEADLPTGEQALQLGVLAQAHERYAATLEVDASPQTSGPEVSSSPLWNLNQVKMEPQESEEGSGPPHGVLGNDVFEEPMSAMSDSGIPQTPNTTGSDGSYISHSPDSLMASSPVFNQRPKKRLRKN